MPAELLRSISLESVNQAPGNAIETKISKPKKLPFMEGMHVLERESSTVPTDARFFRGSVHFFGVADAFDGVSLETLAMFVVLETTDCLNAAASL